MKELWTREELRASVVAYKAMQKKISKGEPVVKTNVYKELAEKHGRTAKSFEFRMQNISYVLSASGREWLKGLPPARNVGTNVVAELESILAELEGREINPHIAQIPEISNGRKKGLKSPPQAVAQPVKQSIKTTVHKRDQKIVIWVLSNSCGKCELCDSTAPFKGFDGLPYLEVHHVKLLADGGSDSITNAVALCPNCHREIHYGRESAARKQSLYSKVSRLKIE